VSTGKTLSIDRRFVAQADTAHPKLLFIPTASNDSEEYIEAIQEIYGNRLGCSIDVLRLWSEDRWLPRIAAKISSSDLIYVGGGNTKAMLEKWRELGVDRELRRSIASGKPVGGLSAGAICWFRVGNSDWPQYEQIPNVNTASLTCLGIVDLAICPHTRDEGFRLSEFKAMMLDDAGVGIGLDDCCAIQIQDEEYRIIASEPNSRAHLIYSWKGTQVHEVLEPHDDYRPLTDLTHRQPSW